MCWRAVELGPAGAGGHVDDAADRPGALVEVVVAVEDDVDAGRGVERGEERAQRAGRVLLVAGPGRVHRVVLEDEAEGRGPPGRLGVPGHGQLAEPRRASGSCRGRSAARPPARASRTTRAARPGGPFRGRVKTSKKGLPGQDLVVVVAGGGVERGSPAAAPGTARRSAGRRTRRRPAGRRRRPRSWRASGAHRLRPDGLRDGVLPGAAEARVAEHDEAQDVGLRRAEREVDRPGRRRRASPRAEYTR